MTKREFLRLEFLKRLDDTLSQYGFKLNKQLAEFTRKTKDGWHKYQVIFLLRDEGWEVSPAMFIRNKIVEDIFHRTSYFEPKYQKGTSTIGCSLGSYEDDFNKYVFDIKEETDINIVASIYEGTLENIVFPFFKNYDSLQMMDDIINNYPDRTKFTGHIHKGSRGVILAKLTQRTDYKQLVEIYTKQYEQQDNGFYLPEFLALVKDLEENY